MLSKDQMKQTIEDPLSDTDIQKILSPNKTNIIEYPDLAGVSDIFKLFDRLGRCVVYIPISDTFGHWTGLTLRDNGKTIEWFDPYGVKPDGEKKWISPETLRRLKMEKPLLLDLLQKAKSDHGCKITYSPYHWQADKEGVNDCGDWVSVRLLLYKKSLKEINDLIKKSGMKPDDWVNTITYHILGK